MILFKNKYRVESTRLRFWNYSNSGYYFVTICTRNREHFFGEIVEGRFVENLQSRIVSECWEDLPHHYNNCILDEFIVMPNHVHGIIVIDNDRDDDNNDNYHSKFNNVVETGLKPVSTKKKISRSEPVNKNETLFLNA